MHGHSLGGQRLEAEIEATQGHQHQGRAARQEQDRLGDLYPCGGEHAAEDDIDQHQQSDYHHRRAVVETEQQFDQLTGTDHLHHQIAAHHGQRSEGGEAAHAGLIEAVGDDVGEGVAPQVAQALGHQEGDDRPADKEADDVDETVVALGEDQARQAQQRGGRHVVTGDCQAILKSRDTAAGAVEIGGGAGAPCRPPGDQQGGEDEDEKHADGVQVERLLLRNDGLGMGQHRAEGEKGGQAFHARDSCRICELSTSKRVLALCTYQAVSSQDNRMIVTPIGMPRLRWLPS
ncbi:hypothetical protein D3C73_915180 [compost metagenome]